MNANVEAYAESREAGKAPEAPAKLTKRLKGDLDNIVLKALRKEPARRYASAEQLAEDIRRYLREQPVSAAPDSVSYRINKFVRRHKVGVAATVLIVAVALGGVAATLREASIAAANARSAEERFNDLRKLANSLMFEIHDSIRDLPGSTPARRLLVTRALEYLDGLSQQSRGDVALQEELAAAYERVGDVLGYPYAANLGDKAGALESYRKALTIRQSLASSHPSDTRLTGELARDYFRIAQVSEAEGNFASALEAMRRALSLSQTSAATDHDPARVDQLAGAYYFTASLLSKTGDATGAMENYQRAAAIRQAGLQVSPDNTPLRTHLAGDYAGIASALEQKGDLANAIQKQAQAVTILTEVSRANPNSTAFREFLGEATNRIATYKKEQGDTAAALETYRRAHSIFRDLLATDPANALAKSNFASSDSDVAGCLVAQGKPAEAIQVLREAIVTFEAMTPGTTSDRYVRTGLAEAYLGLGSAYTALANDKSPSASQQHRYWKEARAACQKSLAWWKEKEQRRELESSERGGPQQAVQCITRCDSGPGGTRLSKHNPH